MSKNINITDLANSILNDDTARPKSKVIRMAKSVNYDKCKSIYPELYNIIEDMSKSKPDTFSMEEKHRLYTEFNRVKNTLSKKHVFLYYAILEALDGYSEVIPDYFLN